MRDVFERAALAAGRKIMGHYRASGEHDLKIDGSPVTKADIEGEALIVEMLRERYPSIPIISEEADFSACAPHGEVSQYILVDALDGTKEFLQGLPDFTVNIAYVCDGHPGAGVVYAPARAVMYSASEATSFKCFVDQHTTVSRRDLIVARTSPSPPTIAVSRSHMSAETEEFLAKYDNARLIKIGSSLKLCLIAEGLADLYPRFGRTMQWDIAAGHAVLIAAGGSIKTVWGAPYRYSRPDFAQPESLANPWFIAHGLSSNEGT